MLLSHHRNINVPISKICLEVEPTCSRGEPENLYCFIPYLKIFFGALSQYRNVLRGERPGFDSWQGRQCFSFRHRIQTDAWAHPASYQRVLRVISTRVKLPGHETDRPPPKLGMCGAKSSLHHKSSWCGYYLSKGYVFMAWCLAKNVATLTFPLNLFSYLLIIFRIITNTQHIYLYLNKHNLNIVPNFQVLYSPHFKARNMEVFLNISRALLGRYLPYKSTLLVANTIYSCFISWKLLRHIQVFAEILLL
jgi:hypothetical protein